MPIQMKQIEDEVSKRLLHALLKRRLQISKASRAVVRKHNHFAVKNRLLHRQFRHESSNRLHPVSPVQPRTRQQLNPIAIFVSLDAIAIELEFMQPSVPRGRRLRLQCELRSDEVRQ